MAETKQASILVVDDEKMVAENLVEFLTLIGHHATAAYGGKEGLEAFRNGAFDLVITDLMMPDMDGMQLMEAIKTIDAKTPVLMITGHGTIESAVAAIKKGAYDFIPKPFNLSELEVIANRALEHREMAKQLGLFRGLTLALVISVPVWLLAGAAIAVWGPW